MNIFSYIPFLFFFISVTLAENGRLPKINSVIDKFNQIMTAHRGEVSCTVRTAKPLDKTSESELRNALSGFLKPGEKLQLTLEVSFIVDQYSLLVSSGSPTDISLL
ncbi:unnamed protein product [Trichobilharzia regenti]|nr:unnamed protein product [Trichobilharzia regenti]